MKQLEQALQVENRKNLIKIFTLFIKTLIIIQIRYSWEFGNIIIITISDGHGSVGHDVSSFLKKNLPITLDNELKKRCKINNNTSQNKIIQDVFLSVNCKLFNEASIDTYFRYLYSIYLSGSTCVSLIYTKEKLLCANVGDSRAVLGRCTNGGIIILLLIIHFSF